MGLYERDGLWFSEPAELIRLLLTGRPEPVPLVRGHLGEAAYAARLIFGRETLEIREAGAARYAGMLGIKKYPATTRPGLWDGLLAAPFPLVASQSFAFLSKAAALGPCRPAERSLSALRALLGQSDPTGLGARLARWTKDGPLGWVFDNDADLTELEAPLPGFDLTQVLDAAEIRDAVVMYLFHRLAARLDGRRLVIDVDKFWKALVEDGLKTFRKQNALLVLGTQSPADVLRSPIAHTILEQCATQIFLPNPHATAADYVDGFGLTRGEFQLIRDELDLTGLEDQLAILSGRSGTTGLLDRLRALYGEDPGAWFRAFRTATNAPSEA